MIVTQNNTNRIAINNLLSRDISLPSICARVNLKVSPKPVYRRFRRSKHNKRRRESERASDEPVYATARARSRIWFWTLGKSPEISHRSSGINERRTGSRRTSNNNAIRICRWCIVLRFVIYDRRRRRRRPGYICRFLFFFRFPLSPRLHLSPFSPRVSAFMLSLESWKVFNSRAMEVNLLSFSKNQREDCITARTLEKKLPKTRCFLYTFLFFSRPNARRTSFWESSASSGWARRYPGPYSRDIFCKSLAIYHLERASELELARDPGGVPRARAHVGRVAFAARELLRP